MSDSSEFYFHKARLGSQITLWNDYTKRLIFPVYSFSSYCFVFRQLRGHHQNAISHHAEKVFISEGMPLIYSISVMGLSPWHTKWEVRGMGFISLQNAVDQKWTKSFSA